MNCSLCAAPAENITPADFDGLAVRCRHCGEYEITEEALNTLLARPLAERGEPFRKAQRLAGTGARPVITADCL